MHQAESNPRPTASEAATLSTELLVHKLIILQYIEKIARVILGWTGLAPLDKVYPQGIRHSPSRLDFSAR